MLVQNNKACGPDQQRLRHTETRRPLADEIQYTTENIELKVIMTEFLGTQGDGGHSFRNVCTLPGRVCRADRQEGIKLLTENGAPPSGSTRAVVSQNVAGRTPGE